MERWGRVREHDLKGRGQVHVLTTSLGDLVAKRMSRGGIIGGLLRESYADPDRPLREALLAEQLIAAGCRTPAVAVARATRRAPGSWRLELATVRVQGARDLLDVLLELQAQAADPGDLAERSGRSLAGLHGAGLHHRDLQVKNLLVEPGDGPLVVIDLDRCQLARPLPPASAREGLLRFLRSLAKHGLLPRAGADPEPRFAGALLQGVLEGYGDLERAGLDLPSLRTALARQLRFHAPFWPRVARRSS